MAAFRESDVNENFPLGKTHFGKICANIVFRRMRRLIAVGFSYSLTASFCCSEISRLRGLEV